MFLTQPILTEHKEFLKKKKKTPNPLKAINLVALSYLAANTHCNIVYMQL